MRRSKSPEAERQLANLKDRHVAAQKQLSRLFKRQRGPLGVDDRRDYLDATWFRRRPYVNYEILASHMDADFILSMPRHCRKSLDPTDITFGFQVVGRTLSFAPEAYTLFSRVTQRPIDTHDLGQILKDNYHNATPFSRMDTNRAGRLENATGLRYSATDLTPPKQPFIMQSSDAGPAYIPNPMHVAVGEANYNLWVDEQTQMKTFQKPASFQKCAALGIPLQRIWNEAVDRCVASPYLFEQSLGQLQLLATTELELIS